MKNSDQRWTSALSGRSSSGRSRRKRLLPRWPVSGSFWVVEENETGQLARLVRQYGYTPTGKILKYDGRPFFVDELEAELRKVII